MQPSPLTDQVRRFLQTASAASSSDLQRASGVSQASISRALAPLLASGQVLRVGGGRSQSYVMPRAVDAGVSSTGTIPIMKVTRDGRVTEFGTLIPAVGGRCWVNEFEGPLAKLHDGLPWFLADMRPQGFLGRSFAQTHAELGLTGSPDYWTDDDILRALCQAGEDLPGNLIVGAKSYHRLIQSGPTQRVSPEQYPALANAAMRGALPGSSAGGEQPKFCTVRGDGRPVIVKFSPAGNSAPDRRWADLLVCEHLAMSVLDQFQVPAAATRIVKGEGRTFLEVQRFDRTPEGRIGMVSLLAFDAEYIGQMDNWAAAAERMKTRGLLREPDSDRLRLLEAYGQLIGNSDRHYGNISLLIDQAGNWQLAPAYDMLPMIYAPVAGELIARDDFNPGAMAPAAQTLRVWQQARTMALAFWKRAADEVRISKGFRALAQRHVVSLATAD